MDFWQPAVDTAAALTAAGLRATTDPADQHAPVVLVQPVGVTLHAGGCADVTLQVTVATSTLDHAGIGWLWGTALPLLLDTVGGDQITPDETADGRPAVTTEIFVMVKE